jgi:apolipoprotein N-acyltransferase
MIASLRKYEQRRRAKGYEKPALPRHPLFNSMWIRISGSILSGVLLALSFPGFSRSTLAYAALVPLMFAVQSLPARKAAGLGLLAGFVFYILSLSWLRNLTGTVDSAILQVSALAGYVFLAFYCGLYFIPFCIGTARAVEKWPGNDLRQNLRFMFVLTAVWVGAEYLRSVLFTGFPWNALGVSQYANPAVIQIAQWGGVYIVSAMIVWMNVALFITFRQYTHGTRTRKYRPHFELMLGMLPVALSIMFGMKTLFNKALTDQAIHLALIQPNIPQQVKWENSMAGEIHQSLAELTDIATRLPGVDLVVWPESAIPELMYSSVGFGRSPEASELIDIRLPLLTGVNYCDYDGETPLIYNSAALFDANGDEAGIYHKQHLVPFGEYVPIPGLRKFTAVSWESTAGTESTILQLPGKAPFSVLICFEDTVAPLSANAVRGGARWLVNQTNDGWFDPSSQSVQHMAHAVFRCIENRVPMARCCNTGLTCFIDAYGLIESSTRIDPRIEWFSLGAVYPRLEQQALTFYTRHGDLFAGFCLIAAPVSFVLMRTRRRTNKKSS